jgi:pimeloyl-ACP methyl ester carboxylesterase
MAQQESRKIRFVEASLLTIAYEERGPRGGFPVVLLHGWPDDVRTWDRVAAKLNEAGFRTIAPYLRGFGPTQFCEKSTMRSGQLSALGSDAIEMAQALGLDRFALVGHDWGARAAYIAATELSERVTRLVAIAVGYGTNSPDQQLALTQIKNYWYHWYFSLPRGIELVKNARHELGKFMWKTWSPAWQFSEAEYAATAASFENPDWADVTIHSYRHRWGYADGDPRYSDLEHRLAPIPPVTVPTLVLHGEIDACNDPATSAGKEKFFTNRYVRKVLPNVGHFPQREDPERVAGEIIVWLRD